MTVLALLWAAVAAFAPSLTRGPAQRALLTVFLTLALAKTVVLRPVADVINAAPVGIDLMPLVHHLLGVFGAGALLRFMSRITAPTRPELTRPLEGPAPEQPSGVRRRPHELTVALATSILLTVLYLATPHGVEVDLRKLLEGPPLPAVAVAYWLVLELYLGATLVAASRLFWRLGARSQARLLRASLRTVAVGTVINAAFAAVKSGYILAHSLGARPPSDQVAGILDLMLTVAVILAVSGGLVPTISAARRWLHSLRRLRSLHPLWQLMATEFPAIVLHYPRRSFSVALDPGELHFRLYRRIIEIRDGMLELSNFVPADVAAQAREHLAAAGIADGRTDALVDAAWVELGLRRVRSGTISASRSSHPAAGGDSIEDEAAWLTAVSEALLRSPYPARFADWWIERQATSAADHDDRSEDLSRNGT